jgi:hypothetical protein
MSDQPITIPVDEPSAEERAKEEEQRRLSELISEVIGEVRVDVDWAYQKVNQASDHDSTDQLNALSTTLADLAAKASAATSRLTAAGIGEMVFSVQACRNVSNHASLAASDASEAANADSATPTHFKLQSVRDQMALASSALNGA